MAGSPPLFKTGGEVLLLLPPANVQLSLSAGQRSEDVSRPEISGSAPTAPLRIGTHLQEQPSSPGSGFISAALH